MPQTIDEEKFAAQETLDMTKPQGSAQGLPVKQIAHAEYPRCAYKHPVAASREILHRNAQHEVVHRELIATEHLVHICQNDTEFRKKLKEGWRAEPYIMQAPPDPTMDVYNSTAPIAPPPNPMQPYGQMMGIRGMKQEQLARTQQMQTGASDQQSAQVNLQQQQDQVEGK